MSIDLSPMPVMPDETNKKKINYVINKCSR